MHCCSPTRASIQTGRYTIRYGLQTNVIPASKAYGVDLAEKLLPQYLEPMGYRSHAIGKVRLESCDEGVNDSRTNIKTHSLTLALTLLRVSLFFSGTQWHLGMFTWEYTPTFRGYVRSHTLSFLFKDSTKDISFVVRTVASLLKLKTMVVCRTRFLDTTAVHKTIFSTRTKMRTIQLHLICISTKVCVVGKTAHSHNFI